MIFSSQIGGWSPPLFRSDLTILNLIGLACEAQIVQFSLRKCPWFIMWRNSSHADIPYKRISDPFDVPKKSSEILF